MVIQTERLLLKSFSTEDEREILQIMTNECVKQTYLVPDFVSEEQGLQTARRIIALSKNENRCAFGIYREDTLVGFINDVEILGKSIELGYVIAPMHQNLGYATEALRAVIKYLFETGYEEIIAGAFSSNFASIRVMEKCGMRRIAKRAEIEYRGRLHDCVYYAVKNF